MFQKPQISFSVEKTLVQRLPGALQPARETLGPLDLALCSESEPLPHPSHYCERGSFH